MEKKYLKCPSFEAFDRLKLEMREGENMGKSWMENFVYILGWYELCVEREREREREREELDGTTSRSDISWKKQKVDLK